MTELRYTDVSTALPDLMGHILRQPMSDSRGGLVKEALHQTIVLTEPWRREVLTPGRHASLPAQIAETMWLLAGRDDVEWLATYLPRAPEFSDDGKVWRGAYGKRLRSWRTRTAGPFDQLAWVIELLRKDPLTRRAVMAIYDPDVDTQDGKDIPCNDFLQFQAREGKLHAHIFIRSNDLMWGWSGINAFEWSVVQEIVASMTGNQMGELRFSISNLHLYDRHWDRAERIAAVPERGPGWGSSPTFWGGKNVPMDEFDDLIKKWFLVENRIRLGDYASIDTFLEPMLQNWLRVLAWWWSGDDSHLEPLRDTPLRTAALLSLRQADPVMQAPAEAANTAAIAALREATAPMARDIDWSTVNGDPFTEFVVNLHREKSAVYGDSWKRRGESGILANIARKIDRLGVAGAGDTSADTVIDLLVYLVLYWLWLGDPRGDQDPEVAEVLRALPADTTDPKEVQRLTEWLVATFDMMTGHAVGAAVMKQTVKQMIAVASPVARCLWTDEQQAEGASIDKWMAGEGGQKWNPDADAQT